jgi:hypothetical protein
MFDLEQAVRKWRRRLAASGVFSPETLDELESHVREEAEQQERAGATPENAFELSTRRLGQGSALQAEFAKAGPLRGSWLVLLFCCLGCALCLMLIGGWSVLAFETSGAMRALGLTALAAIAIYLVCLPFTCGRLLASAGFGMALKWGAYLAALWVLWLLLIPADAFDIRLGISGQSIIWALCAAHGVTCLAGLYVDREPSPIPFFAADRLTLPAYESLGAAREEAQGFNHNFVGTEHLLLGVLESKYPGTAEVLKQWNVNEAVIRGEIENLIGVAPSAGSGQMSKPAPFTPRARKALLLAAREAKRSKQSTVSPEHILVGLIEEGSGVAALILRKLGVDRAAIRKRLALPSDLRKSDQ